MEIKEVTDALERDTEVGSSVVTLVNKIAEALDGNASKKSIADTLTENANEIADAVVANTSAPEAATLATDPLNPKGERRNADGQPWINADGTEEKPLDDDITVVDDLPSE